MFKTDRAELRSPVKAITFSDNKPNVGCYNSSVKQNGTPINYRSMSSVTSEGQYCPIIKTTLSIVTTIVKYNHHRGGQSSQDSSHVNHCSKVVDTHSTSICHPGLDALLDKSLNGDDDDRYSKCDDLNDLFDNHTRAGVKDETEELFTIEQLELIRRLKKSGVNRDQVSSAFTVIDNLEKELNGLFDYTFNLFPLYTILKGKGSLNGSKSLSQTNGQSVFMPATASPDSLNLDLVAEEKAYECLRSKISQGHQHNLRHVPLSTTSINPVTTSQVGEENGRCLEKQIREKIGVGKGAAPNSNSKTSSSYLDKDLNYLLSLPIYFKHNDFLKHYNRDLHPSLETSGKSSPNGKLNKAPTTNNSCDSIDDQPKTSSLTDLNEDPASLLKHASPSNAFLNQHRHIGSNAVCSNINSGGNKPKLGQVEGLSPMALYQILMKKILTSMFIRDQRDLLVNSLMGTSDKSLHNMTTVITVINNAMAISTFFAAMVLTCPHNYLETADGKGLDPYDGTFDKTPPLNGVSSERQSNGLWSTLTPTPTLADNHKPNDTISSLLSTTKNHPNLGSYSLVDLDRSHSIPISPAKSPKDRPSNDTCLDFANTSFLDYVKNFQCNYVQSYNLQNYLHQEYLQSMDPWNGTRNPNFASLFTNNLFYKRRNSAPHSTPGLFLGPDEPYYNLAYKTQPDFSFYNGFFQAPPLRIRQMELTSVDVKEATTSQGSNSSTFSTLDSEQEANEDEPMGNSLVTNSSVVEKLLNDGIKKENYAQNNYKESPFKWADEEKFAAAPYTQPKTEVGKLNNFPLKVGLQMENSGYPTTSSENTVELTCEDVRTFAKRGTKKCAELIRNFLIDNNLDIKHVSSQINVAFEHLLAFLKGDDTNGTMDYSKYTLYRWYLKEREYLKCEINGQSSFHLEHNHLTQGNIKRKIHDIMENLYGPQGSIREPASPFYPILANNGADRKKLNWTSKLLTPSATEKPQIYYQSLKQQAKNSYPTTCSVRQAVTTTAAPNGKGGITCSGQTYKRERFTFKSGHLEILERFFREDAYPDSVRREFIAETCNAAMTRLDGRELLPRERVTTHVVANWFANRRKESRRQKKTKENNVCINGTTNNQHETKPHVKDSSLRDLNEPLSSYREKFQRDSVYRFSPNENNTMPLPRSTSHDIVVKSEPKAEPERTGDKRNENGSRMNGLGAETSPIKGLVGNLDEEMAAVNTTIMALVNQHGIDLSSNTS